jgi:hypothetical protein
MNLLLEQRVRVPIIGKLGEISKNDLLRILKHIDDDVYNKKICWIWNIESDEGKGHQHPRIGFNKKSVMIHRLMYHNFIEDVPVFERKSGALIVLHKCSHENNGRCINPWHMKLGTNKENTADAMKDNTLTLLRSNEKHPLSKLPNEKINEIMRLKDSGVSQKKIGERYGINQSQISRYWNEITRKQ